MSKDPKVLVSSMDIREDIVRNWTGNRMKDLAPYFLTPYQEEADQIWHREAGFRYEREVRTKRESGC